MSYHQQAAAADAGSVHVSDPSPWFGVMVRPGHEKFASRALRNRGYEEFMPTYRERRRWSDRIKEVELALFPGYLFCRLNPQDRLPILTAPGVFGIISFSGVPHPIADAEVSRVKALVNNGKNPQPWPYLKAGQRVLIGTGPLSGVEGILVHIKNEYRLVASVTLLQRSVSVEIDADSVTPIR